MNWFYALNGQQTGPVSEAEFEQLIAAGTLRGDTLVWKEGMAGWQPLSAVRPIAAPAPVSNMAPAFPATGGPNAPVSQWSAAQAPTPQPAGSYAGFWVRVIAFLIDRFILGIASLVIMLVIAVPFGLLGVLSLLGENPNPAALLPLIPAFALIGLAVLALNVGYEIYYLTKRAATPGKLMLGLRVIKTDGTPITVGLAIGRFFGKILSGMIFYIGFIMAGFDDQKRALHDHLCNTRVVTTR